MAADQGTVEKNAGFEFQTRQLGRIRCQPLNWKLLFKLTDLIKDAPDTVPDFVCSLLSVVCDKCDAAVPEERVISREQAKTLTEVEMEQFAARFLEAFNWAAASEMEGPTAGRADKCTYGERLKWAFEAYEKSLANQTRPYRLVDVSTNAALNHNESRLSGDASNKAEMGFWSAVKKCPSVFWNGGFRQKHRSIHVARANFKSFFTAIREALQFPNKRIPQAVRDSVVTTEGVKESMANRDISFHARSEISRWLQKIWTHPKPLRSTNEFATKAAFRPTVLSIIIVLLLGPLFLCLIAWINSRSQELVAIGTLADGVRSLSKQMEAEKRELATLIKQNSCHQWTSARQTIGTDTKHKTRRARHVRHSLD